MAAKTKTVRTYEIGVKNRKPYTIDADRMTFGSYGDSSLKFYLGNELVFAVAHQKWDYLKASPTRDLTGDD